MSKFKILHLSLLVSAAILNIGDLYASSAAATVTTIDEASSSSSSSASSASTLVVSSPLRPDDKRICLADFKDKTQVEINKLSLGGFMAKNKGDFDTAIPLLEEAVRYGHLNSMVLLGQICEARKDFSTAYMWYVLAFEEHWINTEEHLTLAKDQLKREDFLKKVRGFINQ